MPLSLNLPATAVSLSLFILSACGGETDPQMEAADLDRAITCAAAYTVQQRSGDPQAVELADRWGRMAFNYTPRGQLFASGYIDSINQASRLSSREPARFSALLSDCAVALNEAAPLEESRIDARLANNETRHRF